MSEPNIESVEELEYWIAQQADEADTASWRQEVLLMDKPAAAWHRGYRAAMLAVLGKTEYIHRVGFGLDAHGEHCDYCDSILCEGIKT